MFYVLIGLHLLISKIQKGNQDTTKFYINQVLGKYLQGCRGYCQRFDLLRTIKEYSPKKDYVIAKLGLLNNVYNELKINK